MAATFHIEPGQSRIVVSGRSTLHPLMFQAPVTGSITVVSGPEGVDLASPIAATIVAQTSELTSGEASWDSELRQRLEADRHPRVVATIHGARSADGSARSAECELFDLFGDLTIRGRSQPLEARAHVTIGESTRSVPTLRASGTFSFDIREFGIEPPRLLLLRVQPDITATLELIAISSSVAETRLGTR